MIAFKARRPLLRNAVILPVSAALLVLLPFLFVTLYRAEPVSFADKLLQCLLFCGCAVGELFTLGYFCDSLRNLLAPPTVYTDESVLRVFGFPETPLDGISRTELSVKTVKGKKRETLTVYLKNGEEPLTITGKLTATPLSTVKYAVDTRLKR